MRPFLFIQLLVCLLYTYLHGDFNSSSPFDTLEQPSEQSGNGIAYEFVGFHLVSSFMDCELSRLTDLDGLREAMQRAVNASGATILKQMEQVFPSDGFTMVILLSESHASIHTYPEHGACFVDFFTCGRHCSSDNFERVLRDYLRPKKVICNLLYRDSHLIEVYHDKN